MQSYTTADGCIVKIAIIGSGISGLSAAYLLQPTHEITVYEKNSYIGGHARTVDVQLDGQKIPVDTGFIVFNERNYPLLTGLFRHLQVPVEKSDMSFGVNINHGWLEYSTQSAASVFAQRRNLTRPAFWMMIRDIFRFNCKARRYLETNSDVTLGQCLDELGMSEWFRDYYLLAMGGAIWSTPVEQMLSFPARTFIRFFDNHGLLTIADQPQWYTVRGGSREYIKRLTADFAQHIHLNCGVERVERTSKGVCVTDEHGHSALYDQVIFASHADQTLRMLTNASEEEKAVLGAFSYQPNSTVLHRDTSFMPQRRNAWASWVYLSESSEDKQKSMCLSYWMNNLQPLSTQTPMIVTLNTRRAPDAALVDDQHDFEHPLFDTAAIDAQEKVSLIQGKDRIWYCGAWQRYGFHEDGLMSAVAVAEQLGATVPWK
jgi:predicted NAD/FAD-binding protein